MGDFNVNVSKQIKGSKDIQEFTNLFLSNSFLPLIDKPTRITGKSATLIDNMYTNFSTNNCRSGILCTDFSDHFPISRRHEISLHIQCCHKKCQNRKIKNHLFFQNIFLKKYTILENIRYIFRFWRFFPSF